MKGLIKALFIVPVFILVVIFLAGVFGNKDEKRKKQPRPSIGDTARDFTYPDLQGRDVKLSDFYGKKVVLLNVWATWCTSCKKELPTVQRLYERFKGDDFEVLAVSIDALGKKAVEPFMKKLGLTFPALIDTSGSIQLLYGTTGVPESFIIDKKGRIAYVEIGAGDWTDPEKQALVKGLIDEPDLEVPK